VGPSTAVITGLHHLGLTVSDAERSAAFYRGLGFELVSDREVEGGYVEEITGVPEARVRLVLLSGFGHNLELLEFLRPRGEARARRSQDAGSAHICLLTEDLDGEVGRLRRGGVPVRSNGPVTITSGPNRGGRGVYAEDPDGNAVEIVEPAPISSAS
jgi:catechol 2,3-dioxygenase-like lactoylglutathione lyase family enzyme